MFREVGDAPVEELYLGAEGVETVLGAGGFRERVLRDSKGILGGRVVGSVIHGGVS